MIEISVGTGYLQLQWTAPFFSREMVVISYFSLIFIFMIKLFFTYITSFTISLWLLSCICNESVITFYCVDWLIDQWHTTHHITKFSQKMFSTIKILSIFRFIVTMFHNNRKTNLFLLWMMFLVLVIYVCDNIRTSYFFHSTLQLHNIYYFCRLFHVNCDSLWFQKNVSKFYNIDLHDVSNFYS